MHDLNKILATLLLFFSSFLLHSQQDQWVEINLNAFVLDYDTKKAIPFAEAKIKYKNIGTLTESDGKFSLNYFERNVDDNDIFQLTANGYDTISTSVAKLYKFLNNTNKFYLNKTKSNNLWFEQDTDNANFIFGKIFSVKGPIQGASVKVKNSLIEAKSDFEGFFKIKANIDDILLVNYLGMIEKQLLIEDLNDKYILLKTDSQILDQVTITGSTELSDEVDTGYGKKKRSLLDFQLLQLHLKKFHPRP